MAVQMMQQIVADAGNKEASDSESQVAEAGTNLELAPWGPAISLRQETSDSESQFAETSEPSDKIAMPALPGVLAPWQWREGHGATPEAPPSLSLELPQCQCSESGFDHAPAAAAAFAAAH